MSRWPPASRVRSAPHRGRGGWWDIGGPPIRVLRMGPSHRDQLDCSGDPFGLPAASASGQRLRHPPDRGGMMPPLGMHETLKTGATAPSPFWGRRRHQ